MYILGRKFFGMNTDTLVDLTNHLGDSATLLHINIFWYSRSSCPHRDKLKSIQKPNLASTIRYRPLDFRSERVAQQHEALYQSFAKASRRHELLVHVFCRAEGEARWFAIGWIWAPDLSIISASEIFLEDGTGKWVIESQARGEHGSDSYTFQLVRFRSCWVQCRLLSSETLQVIMNLVISFEHT